MMKLVKSMPTFFWVMLVFGIVGLLFMFWVVHTADVDDEKIPYQESGPPVWSSPTPSK
jgi:hypothetical protein